jgi:cell wall assembly regulator SMI1
MSREPIRDASIHWHTFDALWNEGLSITHFDRTSGTFRSTDAEVIGDDAPFVCVTRWPIRPRALEHAIIAGIADPAARSNARRLLGALDDLTTGGGQDRRDARKRLNSELEAHLAQDPAVSQRWRLRRARTSQLDVLSSLERARVELSDAPTWVEEARAFRDAALSGVEVARADDRDRIARWLSANAPASARSLADPATEADFARWRIDEPHVIPALSASRRALHRWHDGQRESSTEGSPSGGFFLQWRLLPIDDALRESAIMNQLVRDGAIPAAAWDPHWLPLLSNGMGDLYCEDTSPEHGGEVLVASHEDLQRTVVFDDLDALLTFYADALEDGLLEVVDGDPQPRSWDEWTLRLLGRARHRRIFP